MKSNHFNGDRKIALNTYFEKIQEDGEEITENYATDLSLQSKYAEQSVHRIFELARNISVVKYGMDLWLRGNMDYLSALLYVAENPEKSCKDVAAKHKVSEAVKAQLLKMVCRFSLECRFRS